MLRIASEFDSAELSAEARRDLDSVAAALSGPELAGGRLALEEHTDARGTADYNLHLSQRRADAVVVEPRAVRWHNRRARGRHASIGSDTARGSQTLAFR